MIFSRLIDYGVTEITWENGQPTMHECGMTNETLESIVHHATTYYNKSQYQDIDLQTSKSLPRTYNISSNVASSGEKRVDTASPSYLKKRPRSSATVHDQCVRSLDLQEDDIGNSKDNDTTMMTWPSPGLTNQSLKSKRTDDDSDCQNKWKNQEKEECKNEGDIIQSQSSRQSRAAAIHNQSERRRRERINQKMKALQKLVPNANKTDKASMLDEVIDYIKKLQTQVQIMKNMSIPPPQMMIPVPLQLQQQQHHLQVSMLAEMGMGLGFQMGMPLPLQHPFMVPQTMASPWSHTIHNHPSTNSIDPLNDPRSTFLAQVRSTRENNGLELISSRQCPEGVMIPNHLLVIVISVFYNCLLVMY